MLQALSQGRDFSEHCRQQERFFSTSPDWVCNLWLRLQLTKVLESPVTQVA
jgi:hypothetical protein